MLMVDAFLKIKHKIWESRSSISCLWPGDCLMYVTTS